MAGQMGLSIKGVAEGLGTLGRKGVEGAAGVTDAIGSAVKGLFGGEKKKCDAEVKPGVRAGVDRPPARKREGRAAGDRRPGGRIQLCGKGEKGTGTGEIGERSGSGRLDLSSGQAEGSGRAFMNRACGNRWRRSSRPRPRSRV